MVVVSIWKAEIKFGYEYGFSQAQLDQCFNFAQKVWVDKEKKIIEEMSVFETTSVTWLTTKNCCLIYK